MNNTPDAFSLRIPRSKLSTVGSLSKFLKHEITKYTVSCILFLHRRSLCLEQTPSASPSNTHPEDGQIEPLNTSFLTYVALSSLLVVFVRPRPCVDCRHVIVCVQCECPRMTESEHALNCLIKRQRHISTLSIVILLPGVL